METKEMDVVGDLIAYEQGDLSWDSTVRLFQHLINTGQAWTLQGHYGRTANQMILGGHCEMPGRGCRSCE